jgi:hypothetical protein
MNDKPTSFPDFEDSYLDVLQNIEATILPFYRKNPDLGDLQVDAAVEALIRTYQGESTGRAPAIPRSVAAKSVYQAVHIVGEWRLGRQGFQNDEGLALMVTKPLKMDEWIACLKRIRKSIQTWNKRNGSQGYLNYIAQFIR